jgi:hypothetical protein
MNQSRLMSGMLATKMRARGRLVSRVVIAVRKRDS